MKGKQDKSSKKVKHLSQGAQSLLQEAIECHQKGQYEEAGVLYQKILDQNPKQVDALHLSGVLAYHQKNYSKAIARMKQALPLAPKAALIYYHLGLACLDDQQYSLAESYLCHALKLDAKDRSTLLALSKALLFQKRYLEAWDVIEQAAAGDPQWMPAQEIKGLICEKQGHAARAMQIYQQILTCDPDNASALNNLAHLCIQMCDFVQAQIHLDRLLLKQPDSSSAFNNLGLLHLRQNRFREAVVLFEKVLDLEKAHLSNPVAVSAALNLALCWRRLQHMQPAVEIYQKILGGTASEWGKQKALAGLSLCHRFQCAWQDSQAVQNLLQTAILDGASEDPPLLTPFESLMLDLSLEAHHKITQQYIHALMQSHPVDLNATSRVKPQEINSHSRLRVGYLSPDFGDHPVGLLSQDHYALHDRGRFEVYGLSLQPHEDPIQRKIQAGVEHWIDLSIQSDAGAIQLLKDLELDLLIDLGGFTHNSRPHLLLAKTARKRVHWLGYPCLMGEACMDYYLAPLGLFPFETAPPGFEKVHLLKNAWFALKPPLSIPSIERRDLGLPENVLIFCCFQRHYRIDQGVFNAWLKILNQVPNSVLWLLQPDPPVEKFMRECAEKKGVSGERLVFSPDEKLSLRYRHQVADLWLDTWSLSAGTGTVLCIFAGLPVLTRRGTSPQSRTAATLLSHMGLSDWVVSNEEEYIQRAVEWASDPEILRVKFRKRLRETIQNNVAFQPEIFIQEFEDACCEMLQGT